MNVYAPETQGGLVDLPGDFPVDEAPGLASVHFCELLRQPG